MTTPTPDEQTGARLAEAIAGVTKRRGGHGNPACYMQSAEDALQAIAADPDILRSMGLGRLLTWNEFVDVILPGPVGDETSVPAGAAAERMRDAGFLRPDPEPPAPTLPTKQDLLHLLNSYESDLQSDRSGLRYRQDILTMFSALYAAAEAGRSQ
jgi:hypothetical protein